MPEYGQDLASELILIVIERLPQVYDGVSEIDPFVWESARRLVMGYSRRARRELSAYQASGDSEGSLFDSMADENAALADAWTQDVVTAEQARSARTRLIERMREAMAKSHAAGSRGTPDGVPAAPGPHVETARQKRMQPWSSRRQLGLTQAQMAKALGMSLSQFRRLEQAGLMPERMRADVEALLKKSPVKLSLARPCGLLEGWAKRLGIAADDVGGLSRMLDVHRTTIFRWRKGLAEPPGPAVLAIEARIEAVLQFRRKQPGGSDR